MKGNSENREEENTSNKNKHLTEKEKSKLDFYFLLRIVDLIKIVVIGAAIFIIYRGIQMLIKLFSFEEHGYGTVEFWKSLAGVLIGIPIFVFIMIELIKGLNNRKSNLESKEK